MEHILSCHEMKKFYKLKHTYTYNLNNKSFQYWNIYYQPQSEKVLSSICTRILHFSLSLCIYIYIYIYIVIYMHTHTEVLSLSLYIYIYICIYIYIYIYIYIWKYNI